MLRAALISVFAIPLSALAADDLASELRRLDGRVISVDSEPGKELPRMVARDQRVRLRAASERENKAWSEVTSRADWETFRDVRLAALINALGQFPPAPAKPPAVRITRTLAGDGYKIENLVYESRRGLVVTANLYSPARPPKSMPALLIAHSHHAPRTQGELQDMGVTWARQGCLVLVPDHLGHGERRQHPFRTEKDYSRPYRVGRQDYYFRYNAGIQLDVIGDSLMGWLVWDLRRGLDVLLAHPGVDPQRVLVLGAVAGGGDPAAVTAALDDRVKAVVPFNFGGAQPDYSTPADAERNFYWFGVPDWESSRCLRRGAADGLAHWVIVASAAPRRVVNAHEFAWDAERDPAWARMQKVFGLYDAADRLAATVGRGSVKGTPPESSHCTNIGLLHRALLYPIFQRWFDMPVPTEQKDRHTATELLALTPEVANDLHPRPLHELAAELGADRAAAARRHLEGLIAPERIAQLRRDWTRLLGDVEPKAVVKVIDRKEEKQTGAITERILLEVEPGIVVPMLLLRPVATEVTRPPVVLALAQDGKQAFLAQRSEMIAALLNGGAAVCLPDVRGTGETQPADRSRRHQSTATDLSRMEWVLGRTLLGARLRDVRSVLTYLRARDDIDARRVALWGDSFAQPNPPDHNLDVPLEVDPFPNLAEPLGGLLALFGALYQDEVRAVYARGGLAGFQTLLHSPFCYVPHDALLPGALTAGDLGDVAAALAPRPVRLETLVDGLNRKADAETLKICFEPARAVYRAAGMTDRLQIGEEKATPTAARWLVQALH